MVGGRRLDLANYPKELTLKRDDENENISDK